MLFALHYCENSLVISDYQHSRSDAINGNPYNTTFNIRIVSGSFSGLGECEYDIKEFIRFAREMNELYEFQRFKVELNDICYGSQVNFEMSKTGHLTISGEIFGNAMIHSLKFMFEADQTALKSFAESLRQLYSL